MIINIFRGNDLRTVLAQKNIVVSLIIRTTGILISFLLVPLTIGYLKTNDYGIWLTLSSILTWINYFDIGLGNGLRNKLTEALAKNDTAKARKYVSTTFALLTIIMAAFYVIFIISNFFLHWDTILNTDESQRQELSKLVLIVFGFFCLQFVLKTTGIVLLSLQKPAFNDLINVLGNLLSLLIIFILTRVSNPSLSYVAIAFSGSPVLVFLVAYFLIFKGKYKFISPKYSLIDFKYTKELIGLGFQFFIIQIAVSLVIYSSTNLIITQMFGNEMVTIYNIAFRYFNALTMIYLIIIMPFWSAATDAYAKEDYSWIKKSVKRLLMYFGITLILTVIMIIFSDTFYRIWLGKNYISIPLSLSILVAIYTILYNWSNTFIYFVNGIGKIRLQLYVTVSVAILYFPIAIFMGKTIGINGILVASLLGFLPASIIMPLQVKKLYNRTAKGIWNK